MGKFVVTDYLAYGPVAMVNLIRSMLATRPPSGSPSSRSRRSSCWAAATRSSANGGSSEGGGLPHVTAVTIHGAAHAINFSHPEQLANVVRSWMADQPIVDDPALPGARASS